jgi:hypothetical protein
MQSGDSHNLQSRQNGPPKRLRILQSVPLGANIAERRQVIKLTENNCVPHGCSITVGACAVGVGIRKASRPNTPFFRREKEKEVRAMARVHCLSGRTAQAQRQLACGTLMNEKTQQERTPRTNTPPKKKKSVHQNEFDIRPWGESEPRQA